MNVQRIMEAANTTVSTLKGLLNARVKVDMFLQVIICLASVRCIDSNSHFPPTSPHVTDINECDLDKSVCSQICINTPGSFHCLCSNGFRLADDERSCTGLLRCDWLV